MSVTRRSVSVGMMITVALITSLRHGVSVIKAELQISKPASAMQTSPLCRSSLTKWSPLEAGVPWPVGPCEFISAGVLRALPVAKGHVLPRRYGY